MNAPFLAYGGKKIAVNFCAVVPITALLIVHQERNNHDSCY